MKEIIQHIKSVYLVSLVLILFLSRCDQFDNKLIIENKSNDIIFFSISEIDSIYMHSPLYIYNNDTIIEESDVIQPSLKTSYPLMGANMWETYINEKCQDSTLRVYFFEKELIMTTPWDTILKKQIYTKKLEYTVLDLEKVNWRIVYE